MEKRTPAVKAMPTKKDRAWFERKVSELIAEVEKLPPDRAQELSRRLEAERSER